MLKCWEFEPEQRPTFKYCLEVLDHAHRDHLRNPTTGAHSQYISTVPDRKYKSCYCITTNTAFC